jgi:antitoxin VapB
MSLNVKDPEARRLAQAIAQATGETMTRAVTEALRERYERLQARDSEALAADIRAIAKRVRSHQASVSRSCCASVRRTRPSKMILDTSPLIAILAEEPDAELYIQAISRAPR